MLETTLVPGTTLVVGRTGREMALAEAVSMSDGVERVLCAPGNVGTGMLPKVENIDLGHLDVAGITRFACEYPDDIFVVIGPRGPQANGLADRLRENEIPVFGSSAAAVRLEKSKIFATGFMKRYGIPHPISEVATTVEQGMKLLHSPLHQVIKADGEAFGKGVVLPSDHREAEQTLRAMLGGEGFSGGGKDGVVIQERLTGPERSVFVVCGDNNYSVLPFVAQDYKRLLEKDQGPNTGGMGSYAQGALHMMTAQQFESVLDIVDRTTRGMADLGTPFQGILYIGLMLAEEYDNQPIVLEFNTRLGDPEAQVVLPLMTAAGFDTNTILYEAAVGRVPDLRLPSRDVGRTALTVSLMAEGYPYSPKPGALIHGLKRSYPNVRVFHSGTVQSGEGGIHVSGGRVLDVTGMAESVETAARTAYAAIGKHAIHFDGMRYRSDIGHNVH